MKVNVKKALEPLILSEFSQDAQTIFSYLPTIDFDTEKIKAIMINEVVADSPENDFYSLKEKPAYLETTIPLFQKAGIEVENIQDIVDLGIYITNAVKLPKTETTISPAVIKNFVPLLAAEIDLFPNLQAIMLNGDVAKKAFNLITKQKTGKNAVPAVSTYKLRNSEVYYDRIRIFPSYIMTGKNILIEKSKVTMSAEDIGKMLKLIQ